MITIDPEFQSLIPALSVEERTQLEANLLRDGCRDPLVVWRQGDDIIIDGHNRYEICTANELHFETHAIDFADRNAAKEWIILNQFGRRNLPNYTRAKLALLLEPIIAAKAKENQRAAEGGDRRSENFQGLENSPNLEIKPINTRAEVAKAANVSDNTIAKVKKIEAKATPEQKQKLEQGTASINEIHNQVKQEEKKEKREEQRQQIDAVQIPDEVEAVAREVKLGEWYELGAHVLYCGDSAEEAFTSRVPKCPFAFADPPYNVEKTDWDSGFLWRHDWLTEAADVVAVTPGQKSLRFDRRTNPRSQQPFVRVEIDELLRCGLVHLHIRDNRILLSHYASAKRSARRIGNYQELVELWPNIRARIRQKIGVTALAYLHDAPPVGFADNEVVLEFSSEFNFIKASTQTERLNYEKFFNTMLDKPRLLRFVLASPQG